LLTQQEIQAMDHFARRYKTKNSKRLKHLWKVYRRTQCNQDDANQFVCWKH
jgi:hypothetical protein